MGRYNKIITDFPPNAQVDFQVETMIGYVHRIMNPNAADQWDLYPHVFTGETSDWSNTQTITMLANVSPSSNSTLITPESPS